MHRYFLVGSPRSGTTILQSVLASHNQIKSFPETHFFLHLQPRHRLLRKFGFASSDVKKRLYKIIAESGVDAIVPDPLVPTYGKYINCFVSILDRLAEGERKVIWVEKTPIHLQFIPTIAKYVRNVRFIHIVRNGMEVARSMYEISQNGLWGKKPSLDEIINRWIFDINISKRYARHPDHIVVKYDELIENPGSSLKKLSDFLVVGNQFSLSGRPNGIIKEEEVWKSKVYIGLTKTKNNIKETFTEEQIAYIKSRIDHINLDTFF